MKTLFRPEVLRARRNGALVGQLRLPPERHQVAAAVGSIAVALAICLMAARMEHTHVQTAEGAVVARYHCHAPGTPRSTIPGNGTARAGRVDATASQADGDQRPNCVYVRLDPAIVRKVQPGMSVTVLAKDGEGSAHGVVTGSVRGPLPELLDAHSAELDGGRLAIELSQDAITDGPASLVAIVPGQRVVVSVSLESRTLLDWLLRSLKRRAANEDSTAGPEQRGAGHETA